MRRLLWIGLLLASGAQAQDDPHQWLEAVQDDKALAFAATHSQRTEAALRATPGFEQLREQLHEVLASPARLAPVSLHGGLAYNFWRDDQHPRGIWRRTPLAAYLAGKPQWQTVLDLDKLARDEKEAWNWSWANCQYGVKQPRCMLALSRGGGDAKVFREFDLGTGAFVPGGFALPEAKSSVAWVDGKTLAVATDFGAGSMTRSGYPKRLKLWARGEALAAAKTVYEIADEDMGLWLWDEQGRQLVVEHRKGFFDGEQLLLRKEKLWKLAKPDHATALPLGERLLLELRKDWTVGGQTYAAGSLLAMGTQALIEGRPKIATLFTPGERSALHHYAALRDAVVAVVQDEQGQRLREWRLKNGRWVARDLPSQGALTLGVRAVDGSASDRYWLTRSGFLQPSELLVARAGSDSPASIQRLPELFDASGLEVQRLATKAADGTRIPYWLVQPKGPVPAGGRPTLLYGYGGFEISLNPSYSGILGRAWLSQGGAYVVANIRGGGEFGPRWHQSAQKEHRQRSFGDFIAVAEDLQRRGLTTPHQLGILGGSLGGLLTSVAMVQRPELFGAVVSQVPLTDMRRYHRLLAGHSWIAEYGDPDIPAEWDYIKAYSPYQQAKAAPTYPPVLYTSSTLDDRVHPGHARKMVARLQELGQPVWYWENREGGHAGASDLGKSALMWAISYRFLQQQLMPPAQATAAAPR